MEQKGAAITDWLTAAVFFYGAWSLSCTSRKSGRIFPRWYGAYFVACVSGGLSCVSGGFMWGWGINKRADEMTVLDMAICDGVILGMFGEALALIAAWLGFRGDVGDRSFKSFSHFAVLLWMGTLVWTAYGHLTGVSNSWLLLPCASMGPALLCLVTLAGKNALGGESAPGPIAEISQDNWMKIFVGSICNLIGAVALGALDNDCTGMYCITEKLPWESSPCRWNLEPRGHKCPLPEDFNHAAVMHVFAIIGILLSASGVQGLFTCGWDENYTKSKKAK